MMPELSKILSWMLVFYSKSIAGMFSIDVPRISLSGLTISIKSFYSLNSSDVNRCMPRPNFNLIDFLMKLISGVSSSMPKKLSLFLID